MWVHKAVFIRCYAILTVNSYTVTCRQCESFKEPDSCLSFQNLVTILFFTKLRLKFIVKWNNAFSRLQRNHHSLLGETTANHKYKVMVLNTAQPTYCIGRGLSCINSSYTLMGNSLLQEVLMHKVPTGYHTSQLHSPPDSTVSRLHFPLVTTLSQLQILMFFPSSFV
jgi:hypothetical protein